MDDNALDLGLAKKVGDFFRLDNGTMDATIDEIFASVSQWKTVAGNIGISRSEQEMMQNAFRVSLT